MEGQRLMVSAVKGSVLLYLVLELGNNTLVYEVLIV